MTLVRVIAAPPNSGKTERLLARYHRRFDEGPPGSTLWLSPTWRAASAVRRRLVEVRPACLAPGVMTFEHFADRVLHASSAAVRPLSGLMKRLLVQEIIARLHGEGRLRHFEPIASRPGLVDMIADFTSDLKRLEIWPDELEAACNARGLTPKDVELLAIYREYQEHLRCHGLYDAEGRFWQARDWLQREFPSGAKGSTLAEGDRHLFQAAAARKTSQSPCRWPRGLKFVAVDGFTDFTRTQHEILEILGRGVDELWITLPLEPSPCRGDLFAKPLATLEQLRRQHVGLVVEELPRAASPWPAMAEVEGRLFGNPRHGQPRADQSSCRVGQATAMTHQVPPKMIGGSSPCRLDPPYKLAQHPTLTDPDAQSAPCNTTGLTIIAGSRPLGEMRSIAGRIKRLLAEGRASADDIAVVFRTPQSPDSLAGEVFAEYGIPAAFELGPPLATCPALSALCRLLRLVLDDWPVALLRSVVRSSYFQPDWQEWQQGRAAVAVEHAVRRCQAVGGRETILAALGDEIVHRPGDSLGKGVRHLLPERPCGCSAQKVPDTFSAAGLDMPGDCPDFRVTKMGLSPLEARDLLLRLAAALDALPKRATRREWFDAWQKLAAEVGLRRVIDWPADGVDARDRLAWNRLQSAFQDSGRLDDWLGRPAAAIDLAAALAALEDVAHSERLPTAGDESGRVRVLSAASIRGLKFKHLFAAGLAEKAFPRADGDDRVYSEAEVEGLIAKGLPLKDRRDRSHDEMLLFYEMITRAAERLYLSYPAINDSGQPLSPSPFVREVIAACGASAIERDEQIDLRPVPNDESPLCPRAWRVMAVARGLEGDASLLVDLCRVGRAGTAKTRQQQSAAGPGGSSLALDPPYRELIGPAANLLPAGLAQSLLSGLRIVALRSHRGELGPAEGLILGNAAQHAIAKAVAGKRTFTATELERYATCPYRYFVEKVLRIKPLTEYDLAADFLERGRIAHDVLAEFHREVNRRLGGPGSPLDLGDDEFDRVMDAAVAAVRPPTAMGTARAALEEADRRVVRRWLGDYRTHYGDYEETWKKRGCRPLPALLEVGFGESRSEAAESTVQPLELTFGGETVGLSGRVDRADVAQVGQKALAIVVDYKIGAGGHFNDEELAAGTSLQLPVYAIAVCELLLADRDALPLEAGYWRLRDGGYKFKKALAMYPLVDGQPVLAEDWERQRDQLAETVIGLVRGLRRGEFPVYNRDCECTGRCDLSTVCRINPLRSLEKTWQRGLGESPQTTD